MCGWVIMRWHLDQRLHLDWSYDYSALTFNRFAFQTATPENLPVPTAPNSAAGGSKGLKITVNKNDDEPGRFALSLYPKTANFSGDYVLKFDAFLNHASFADSGVGTSEFLTFGLNHSGDLVNWGVLSGAEQREDFAAQAVGGSGSDGLWFGVVGDDGAARGLQSWEGQAGQASRYLEGEAAGVPDRDGNGNPDDDGNEPFLRTQFPSPRFEAPGVLGKRWVQVEVSQVGDVITWKINGRIISRRTNTSPWKSGRVMVGYMDPFAGVAEVKGKVGCSSTIFALKRCAPWWSTPPTTPLRRVMGKPLWRRRSKTFAPMTALPSISLVLGRTIWSHRPWVIRSSRPTTC